MHPEKNGLGVAFSFPYDETVLCHDLILHILLLKVSFLSGVYLNTILNVDTKGIVGIRQQTKE